MKHLIIDRNSEWRKPRVVLLVLLLLFLLGFLLMIVLHGRAEQRTEPIGGEIFIFDFEDGVKFYVEEEYSRSIDNSGAIRESPHSIWLVSDEYLNGEILRLCGEIKQYRQVEKSSDIMLGNSDVYENFPRIYLATDAICYRIEILNWKNYSGDAWAGFPIRQELFGTPVMKIFRIDLSHKPESTTSYSFAKAYFGSDSVNSESGAGWYSTISQQSMDELLSLAESIGVENAEKVEDLG